MSLARPDARCNYRRVDNDHRTTSAKVIVLPRAATAGGGAGDGGDARSCARDVVDYHRRAWRGVRALSRFQSSIQITRTSFCIRLASRTFAAERKRNHYEAIR